MKTRLVSILLVLLLVLGMFPVFASADTAAEPPTGNLTFEDNWECFQYNGTVYRMSLGTVAENGRVITSDHSVVISDETDKTTLTSYLLIHDANRKEAPQEVYEALWNSCVFESYVVSDGFEDCPLQTAEDGYHRYLTTTRIGSFDGHFRVVLTDQAGEMAWLYRSISLGIPEVLTPVDGQVSFTVAADDPEIVYYRLDLSAFSDKKQISVTVSEGAYGRIQTLDNDILWIYYADGAQGSYPITVTENEALLSVNVGGRPVTVTITVTEPVNYPVELLGSGRVLVNGTEYIMNIGHWSESGGMNLQSFSTGIMEPSETVSFDSYFFLRTEGWAEASAADYETFWTYAELEPIQEEGSPLTLGKLTDCGPRKHLPFTVTGEYQGEITARVTTPANGNSVICNSPSVHVGLAENLPVTDGHASVTLSANAYEEFFFRVDLGEDADGAGILVGLEDGTHGSIRDGNNNFLWTYFASSTQATTYRTGIKDRYLMLTVYVIDAGETTLTVTAQKEEPRLMYRQMYRPDASSPITENPNGFPLSNPESYALALNAGWNMRLYYGTTYDHVSLNDGTLTSSDPNIVRVDVTPFGENGETYYHLHGMGYGTATLTWGDYSFDLTVGIPDIGPYSAQQRDQAHFLTNTASWNALTQTEDGFRELWFLRKDGFTAAEIETITCNLVDEILADMVFVPRPGTDTFDVKLLLKDAFYSSFTPTLYRNGIAYTFCHIVRSDWTPALYKDDLIIGFRSPGGSGETVINENGRIFDNVTPIDREDPDAYRKALDLELLAGTKSTVDGDTVYTVDQTVTDSLSIRSLTMKVYTGDPTMVSLDPNSHVSTLTDITGTPALWFKPGHGENLILQAEVAGQINGEPFSDTITVAVVFYAREPIVIQRPADDTVEQLNADLAQYAAESASEGAYRIYEIHLPAISYTGTVTMPDQAESYVTFSFLGAEDGGTLLTGGIDLNGTTLTAAENITFRSSGNGGSRAIYGGGGLDLTGCTFSGYDVALDCTEGLINAKEDNLFLNNTIAVLIDIADHTGNMRTYCREWTGNLFLRNGTAVEVRSLSPAGENPYTHVTPFRFRIRENTFLGNGCDFNIDPAGRYFFYYNSFAEETAAARVLSADQLAGQLSAANTPGALNSLATYRQPVIQCEQDVTIVTNPRWMYALCQDFSQNILMSDWSLPTQLPNDSEEDLTLDGSLFASAEEKVIQLVDSETNDVYAHWTFPEKDIALQSAADFGSFHAGVTTQATEEGSLLVTVKDSDVLTREQPMLTVYTDGLPAQVLINGEEIPSTAEGQQITFPVSQGATYTVLFFNEDPDSVAAFFQITDSAEDRADISLLLKNLTDETQSCQLLAVAYTEEGQMCGIAAPEGGVTLRGSRTEEIPLTIALSAPAEQIRVFLLRTENSSPMGGCLKRTIP